MIKYWSQNFMKIPKKILIWIILITLGISLGFFLYNKLIYVFDETRTVLCNKINRGDSREDVIDLLGEPELIFIDNDLNNDHKQEAGGKYISYYFDTQNFEGMNSDVVFDSDGFVVGKYCVDGDIF